MKNLPSPEIWFVCGSQHLYGPGPLKQVAANANAIAQKLDKSKHLPLKVVFKALLTTQAGKITLHHLITLNPEWLIETLLMHRLLIIITRITPHHEATTRHQHHLHAIKFTYLRCPVSITRNGCTTNNIFNNHIYNCFSLRQQQSQ